MAHIGAKGTTKRGVPRFLIQVSLGTGAKRMRRSEYFEGTRRQAERRALDFEREVEAELAERKADAAAGPTVAEYLTDWLRDYASTKKPATESQYRQAVAKVRPRIGHLRVRDVTAAHLVELEAWLRRAGRVQRRVAYPGAGLSSSTIAFYRAVLVKALRMAPKDWRPDLDGLPPLHIVPVREPVRPNAEQARRLLAVLAQPQWAEWRDIWLLAMWCGLRMGELRGLTWQAVDVPARTLHLRQQITRVRGRDVLGSLKNNRPRDVPLPPPALAMLLARRALRPDDAPAALVFGQPDGAAFSDGRARRAFTLIAAQAGLAGATPHSMRHAFVTLSLAAGVPLSYVSRTVGHASTAFTDSVYNTFLPEVGADAAARLAAFVLGPANENANN